MIKFDYIEIKYFSSVIKIMKTTHRKNGKIVGMNRYIDTYIHTYRYIHQSRKGLKSRIHKRLLQIKKKGYRGR